MFIIAKIFILIDNSCHPETVGCVRLYLCIGSCTPPTNAAAYGSLEGESLFSEPAFARALEASNSCCRILDEEAAPRTNSVLLGPRHALYTRIPKVYSV